MSASVFVDRSVNASPVQQLNERPVIPAEVFQRLVNKQPRRWISLWAIKKHWLLLQGARAWATREGAFPISRQTPPPPPPAAKPPTQLWVTQTPHFQTHSATLNSKQENKEICQDIFETTPERKPTKFTLSHRFIPISKFFSGFVGRGNTRVFIKFKSKGKEASKLL